MQGLGLRLLLLIVALVDANGKIILWENHVEYADYTIPVGDRLVLKGDNRILGSLIVPAGSILTIDEFADTSFQAKNIDVYGTFTIGSPTKPYTKKAVFELMCSSPFPLADERRKSIIVRAGASILLFGRKGSSFGSAWTKLEDTAAKGTSCLKLNIPKDWQVGDQIAIPSTDFDPHQTEKRTIVGLNNTTGAECPIQIDRPLEFSHYGRISEGVDQRAEIALLTRNIVFKGCVETSELLQDIGGHMMFMQGFKQVQIQAIEVENFGQGDQIGRYPLHFHVCGKVPDGTFLKSNSIHASNFRAITIHGTQNVLVENNVAFNITGHAIFLEDGAERDNILQKNLIVLVKEKTKAIKLGSDGALGLSAFYITNTANVFVDNVVAAVEGTGFWIHTRLKVKGLSYATGLYNDVSPFKLALKEMRGNTVHSSKFGLKVESPDLDSGDVPLQPLFPSPSYTWSPDEMPTFFDFTMFRCRQGGWFRMYRVVVDGWIVSDVTEGIQMLTQGNTATFPTETYILNSLFVGGSSNRGNLVDSEYQFVNPLESRTDSAIDRADDERMAIKLYDGPVYMRNLTFTRWYSQGCLKYFNPAIGARLFNTFAMSAATSAEDLKFDHTTGYKMFISDRSADGGKTTMIKDLDGSLGGYPNSVVLPAWDFYTTTKCVQNDIFGLTCPHQYTNFDIISVHPENNPTKYGQMILHRNNVENLNSFPPNLGFEGQYIPASNGWLYHPLLSNGASYTLHYLKYTPSRLNLVVSNGDFGQKFKIFIVYPPNTRIIRIQDQNAIAWTSFAKSLNDESCWNCYFYDKTRNVLMLRISLKQQRPNGRANACPSNGCEQVSIDADVPNNAGVSLSTVQQQVLPAVKVADTSSQAWLGTRFLKESTPLVEEPDDMNWCKVGDQCLQNVDPGNRRNGILAFYQANCQGIGCFSNTCRYCKLSISNSNVPFVPCPFDPKNNSGQSTTPSTPTTSTAAPGTCTSMVSIGDMAVGISAAQDWSCKNGGIGCINEMCRLCKTRDTPQSTAFIPCSTFGPPSAQTKAPPVKTPLPITVAPPKTSLPTTVIATQPPSSNGDKCRESVSVGDATVGISAVTDPSCVKGGIGCFSNSCRFCKTRETVQSGSFLACSSPTPAPTTLRPTPPSATSIPTASPSVNSVVDSCTKQVSPGDASVGVWAMTDASCKSGGAGCFSVGCRFCKLKETTQSKHLIVCPTTFKQESSKVNIKKNAKSSKSLKVKTSNTALVEDLTAPAKDHSWIGFAALTVATVCVVALLVFSYRKSKRQDVEDLEFPSAACATPVSFSSSKDFSRVESISTLH
jgi:cell migration-inducing and hyaluronan-binding protein